MVKARNFLSSKAVQFSLALIPLSLAQLLQAGAITIGPPQHNTDGAFNAPGGTSEAPEWDSLRSTVTKKSFSLASDGSGGASLYVEQGTGAQAGRLFLMYDYTSSNSNANNPFFDVFFQNPAESTDYGVRITGNTFQAFEKPFGPPSQLNPDGSFNFGASPWTALTPADLTLADFHGAIGFGQSPNSSSSHLMAEFDLTINRNSSPGLYDPAPAFWSATCTRCSVVAAAVAADPPISSAIFELNPDGTTLVLPVLGPSGGPIQQPTETPEPASLWLITPALALLFRRRRTS